MKLTYLLLFLILFSSSQALELSCKFEEVYQNGQVQQGFFLIKNNKIRYQYNDDNLFTIFHFHNQTNIVNNSNKSDIKEITEEANIFFQIIKISKEYPNFKKNYSFEDLEIYIEDSNNNSFIKRMTVLSPKVNLSIYFQECHNKNIIDIYFQPKPYFNYKFQ